MHELSLLSDLMKKINRIAQEQDAERISVVHVRIGALAHISADHFCEHFQDAAKGGVADGARVDVIMSKDITEPHAQDILLESVELEPRMKTP